MELKSPEQPDGPRIPRSRRSSRGSRPRRRPIKEFIFDTVGWALRLAGLPARDDHSGERGNPAHFPSTRLFDDRRLSAFVVVRDPQTAASARDVRGVRWFLDLDGAVSRLYGVAPEGDDAAQEGSQTPIWLLLDPTLRVMRREPLSRSSRHDGSISPPRCRSRDHAGAVPLHAPVLVAARIFQEAGAVR